MPVLTVFYRPLFQDPKRPQLPEHPNTKTTRVAPPERGDPYQYSGPPRDITRNPVYGGPGHHRERGGWPGEERGYRGPPPPRRDYGGHHRSRGGQDGGFGGRPVITYRDWDAPNDEYF